MKSVLSTSLSFALLAVSACRSGTEAAAPDAEAAATVPPPTREL